jgi:hypothetical protein
MENKEEYRKLLNPTDITLHEQLALKSKEEHKFKRAQEVSSNCLETKYFPVEVV